MQSKLADTQYGFLEWTYKLWWVSDDDFREAASGELGDYGFDVAAFRDGTGLVEFLETAGDIEIVVLDWGLPRVSGIDLLPRLQRVSRIAAWSKRLDSSRELMRLRTVLEGMAGFVGRGA